MTEQERKRIVLFAITSTQFAVPFMLSAVAVALPSIGEHFNSGAVLLSLVESVYIATTAMFLLPFGRYADITGHIPLFLRGMGLFCLMTLLLGFAPSMSIFVILRVLQGLGGAMMMSTGLAILMNAHPREERGRALGFGTAGVYLGISAGPYLGGLLTTALGWRWVFFSGLLPLLLSLVLVLRLKRLDHQATSDPFDRVGALLSALGIGLLVAGSAGSAHILGKLALLAGILSLISFVLWEKRSSSPLLDLNLIRHNRPFALGCLVQFINYAASFSFTFLMSLYLQCGRGISAYEAGSILVVQPLVQAALSPYSGKLADRHPPHLIATFGMVVVTIALGIAATFDAQTSSLTFHAMLILLGIGIAFFSSPNAAVIMGSVNSRELGVASAMTSGMRTSGMTTSMILVSLLLAHTLGDHAVSQENFDQYLNVMRILLTGFTVLSAFGVLLSLKGALNRKPV
ncbi:drug resistance transporter, EmrB/QacA subfamily [Paucidesulfovibrio gracilis DSM 16080]|uniref:Drug resistance transporter, EmrB/QacA subfamily n=1 Tax=Paucidesulfovibrio gracilis DSM 16080 TaxID=1121449 RepID=A0A1T4WJD0_9BACT|nr:MFS transporter [Paucidesulfovibrio gracilis]SKA77279.1 drug resistance transporter, EmrB/QacA subfamily [Paucidesulfovibrio gracilis DSM 16080]